MRRLLQGSGRSPFNHRFLVWLGAAAEPVPQLRVLLLEQRRECSLRRDVGVRVARVEVPTEQLVQLAHAATATPTQARSVRTQRIRPVTSTAHSAHSEMPPKKYT